MRTDICHFFNCPIEKVFAAYSMVIKREFNSDPQIMPVHTIVFGLKFSWKYNMNGGGCHVHFMRCNGGTAVGIRYTIAQLMGARYKKYDQDLTILVEQILGVKAQDIHVDMNYFLNNKESAGLKTPSQTATSPTATPANNAVNRSQELGLFCVGCGSKFNNNDLFCKYCGRKRQ